MAYPSTRRRSPLVPLLVVALVLVVAVAVVLAVALAVRDDSTPSTSTSAAPTSAAAAPAGPRKLSATGIVSALARRDLLDPKTCAAETGVPPATSQSRCDLGDGNELIAMGFGGQAGVRDRLAGWLGDGTLVQGPNWLVNVADLDAATQEAVRAALGGKLVKAP